MVRAPCVDCTRETFHEIVYSPIHNGETRYDTLQCRGCNAVPLKITKFYSDTSCLVQYYPPPISRRKPEWVDWFDLIYGVGEAEKFEGLLEEIYKATQNGLPRLAIMGVRALLEQIMTIKVGDHGNFGDNLKAFADSGYVSVIEYDCLNKILDAGHAVTHRAYAPKKEDLNTILGVMEGILAAIYVHAEEVKGLKVPERPGRRAGPGKGREAADPTEETR